MYIYPELEFFKKLQAAFLIYTKDYLFTKNQEHMDRWYKMSTWAGGYQKKSSLEIARFSVILNLSIKKLWFCANFGLAF